MNNIVEYVKVNNDNWQFIWREGGERREETYFLTGDEEKPPIDDFLKDHKELAHCVFEEF